MCTVKQNIYHKYLLEMWALVFENYNIYAVAVGAVLGYEWCEVMHVTFTDYW